MLRKFIFSSMCFVTALSAAYIPLLNQKQFNTLCAQTSHNVYQKMNENVGFSEKPTTQSKFWETRQLLGNSFFVKNRGVSLSKALEDLLNKDSKTSFEGVTAQRVNLWGILLPFKIDDIVLQLEQKDPNFSLPLMSCVTLNNLKSYAQYYGFFARNIQFKVGNTFVNTQDEWEQLKQFEGWLEKLKPLTDDCCIGVSQEGKTCPYDTIEGGVLYLSNVKGVKGPAKGENLFCVNADKGLYYGFGAFFKKGPKTLPEIAKELEECVEKSYYISKINPYLKELMEKGIVKEMKKDVHPLQYLVDPTTCCYFDIEIIRKGLKLF